MSITSLRRVTHSFDKNTHSPVHTSAFQVVWKHILFDALSPNATLKRSKTLIVFIEITKLS